MPIAYCDSSHMSCKYSNIAEMTFSCRYASCHFSGIEQVGGRKLGHCAFPASPLVAVHHDISFVDQLTFLKLDLHTKEQTQHCPLPQWIQRGHRGSQSAEVMESSSSYFDPIFEHQQQPFQ